MAIKIITGDALTTLRTLEAGRFQCCVTSPPYWGLRNYGVEGQLGLEEDFEVYLEKLVEIFDEVRRVLRDDGTLWLNCGDSYAHDNPSGPQGKNGDRATRTFTAAGAGGKKVRGCKPKDLVGQPWRLAFALRDAGWWLRQDIIYSKPNPMPESVHDRCTKAHEYLFLLSKSPRYYFDAEAIREKDSGIPAGNGFVGRMGGTERTAPMSGGPGTVEPWQVGAGRNKRSVWTIASEPFPESHFAVFPTALVEPCVRAGSSERGRCPECGAAWRRVVEHERAPERETLSPKGAARVEMGLMSRKTGLNEPGWRKQANATSTTLGFRPACEHNLPPVPCECIDPFGGAGTTALVADRLGRDCTLVELNPIYSEMARRRLVADCPMFTTVEVK